MILWYKHGTSGSVVKHFRGYCLCVPDVFHLFLFTRYRYLSSGSDRHARAMYSLAKSKRHLAAVSPASSSWHGSHTRTGSVKPRRGSATLCAEQFAQKIPPQCRQWCRRSMRPNCLPQAGQLATSVSSTQPVINGGRAGGGRAGDCGGVLAALPPPRDCESVRLCVADSDLT